MGPAMYFWGYCDYSGMIKETTVPQVKKGFERVVEVMIW